MHQTDATRAATDVAEFVTDLDGGQFEHMLSIALSDVAAATIDHDKKGCVELKLEFERIDGTHQVRIGHTLKFTRPTSTGKVAEHALGATVLHVGRYGRLSLAQRELPGMPGRSSKPTPPAAGDLISNHHREE